MVEKTVIRRALKRVREALPELKETIYAFDKDEPEVVPKSEKAIEIPVEADNVDLRNLTKEQLEEAAEMMEIFKANPKLAKDTANEIMGLYHEGGKSPQEIINSHYASIVNLNKSKTLSQTIKPIMEGIFSE